ncbi:MAG: hypothetical protein LBL45_00620 [Treponema sp.]|jgi:hypothetical protein|nr:hypothetical protein [Treponema sp.]
MKEKGDAYGTTIGATDMCGMRMRGVQTRKTFCESSHWLLEPPRKTEVNIGSFSRIQAGEAQEKK